MTNRGLTQAQTGNVQANTALALAQARKAGVEATNIETLQQQALQDQINTYRMNINSGQLQETEKIRAKQEVKNMEQQLQMLRAQTQSAKAEAEYGKFAPFVKPAKTATDKVKGWWKGDGKAILKYGPNPKPEGRW